MSTTESPPRRTIAQIQDLPTDQLTVEVKALVAQRTELTRSGYPRDLAEIMLELIVMRSVSSPMIGERLGLSKQAITMRVTPLRKEYEITAESVIEPHWPRPYAKQPTDKLLQRLEREHAAAVVPPSERPAVKAIDKRIKPYAAELILRGRPGDEAITRGRWTDRTGLGNVAAEIGIGRSTLIRIMGGRT